MAHGYRAAWKLNKCRHELEGKRPGNNNYPTKNKFNKRRTHKMERRIQIELE